MEKHAVRSYRVSKRKEEPNEAYQPGCLYNGEKMNWQIFIISARATPYTGITTDPERRFHQHAYG